jgi:hypothetical protein
LLSIPLIRTAQQKKIAHNVHTVRDVLSARKRALRNIEAGAVLQGYSAATCKIITDTRGFCKTSFWRISGCTGNRALRGSAADGYAPPNANPKDLRPLACFDAPQGVDIIPMIGNLAADFELISFG